MIPGSSRRNAQKRNGLSGNFETIPLGEQLRLFAQQSSNIQQDLLLVEKNQAINLTDILDGIDKIKTRRMIRLAFSGPADPFARCAVHRLRPLGLILETFLSLRITPPLSGQSTGLTTSCQFASHGFIPPDIPVRFVVAITIDH